MSLSQIEADLKAQVSRSVCIGKDERGQHYIDTPFTFDDGDEPVIALVPNGKGWVLSDLGNTLLRMSYRLNEDEYDSPDTQRKLDAAIAMAQITKQGGRLTHALPEGEYAYALFEFAHALMRIDEISSPVNQPKPAAEKMLAPANQPQPAIERARAPANASSYRPPFKDEVKEFVSQVLPPDRLEFDWYDPLRDSNKEYVVDCRINGMASPLFLHAPENKTNTLDTTITIYRLRELEFPGEHVAIFRARIDKSAKSKLHAVCDTTFDSLETQRSDIVGFLERTALP